MAEQAVDTDLKDDDKNQGQEGQEDNQNQPEFEIRLGDSPSQSQKGNPLKHQLTRVIGQRDRSREELEVSEGKNQHLEGEIESLRKEVEQLKGGNQSLSMSDFDDEEQFRQAVIKDHESKKPTIQAQPENQFQRFLAKQAEEKAINDHYSRAESLAEKFPDYSVAEKAANDILGGRLSKEVARLSNRSAELMYWFGSNQSEAHRFKDLADRDPIKATIELGRMEAQLNIQQKNSTLPDPDEPLAGGGGSSPLSSFEKRLQKARAKPNNARECINIKKEAQAAGFNLE